MRILYVVSAREVPPKKWGAVEKIIWERKQWMEENGHQAFIHVSRGGGIRSGFLARPWEYDLVHVECDWKIPRWVTLQKLLGFPMLVSTHYGYGPFPERWVMKNFGKALTGLRKAKDILLQSKELETALRSQGVTGTVYVLPNAISTGSVTYRPQAAPDTGAMCLGRIEPRKRQADLAVMLAGAPVPLDFAGPMHPELPEPFTPEKLGSNLRYLGEWTREQVNQQLTDYRALVLISDGETQVPLVTMEAMAAGLSIVTTPESSHNLPANLPFVQIIDPDKDDVAAAVTRAVRENAKYRSTIRDYALAHFDWSVIGPRYIEIAKSVAQHRRGVSAAWRK